MLILELLDINDDNHVRFIYEVRQHPAVARNLFQDPPKSYEIHKEWIEKNQNNGRQIFLLKYIQKNTYHQVLVGYCQAVESKEQVELGWAIAPEYQGKGYGKLGVRLLIEEVRKRNPKRIVLEVLDRNEIGKNLYLKNGFEIERTYQSLGGLIHLMVLRGR